MSNHSGRGVKRQAEDELHGEQRLAKRFDLLNLERNGKLWIDPDVALHPPNTNPLPGSGDNRSNNDLMEVEDTKDRVYIHNLDEELAELEEKPEDERIIFIPDVERHLNGLPKHLLKGGNASDPPYQPSMGNELILYTVPSSLTVPPEQDTVRRAILESRARARREQESRLQQESTAQKEQIGATQNGNDDGYNGDDEAMDIG